MDLTPTTKFREGLSSASEKAAERLGSLGAEDDSSSDATETADVDVSEPEPEPELEEDEVPPITDPTKLAGRSDVEGDASSKEEQASDGSSKADDDDLSAVIERLEREQEEHRFKALKAQQEQAAPAPPKAEPKPVEAAPTRDPEASPAPGDPLSRIDPNDLTSGELALYEVAKSLQKKVDQAYSFAERQQQQEEMQRQERAVETVKKTVSEFAKKTYPDVFEKSPMSEVYEQLLHNEVLYASHDEVPLITARLAHKVRNAARTERAEYVKSKVRQAKQRTVSGTASSRASGGKKKTTMSYNDLVSGRVLKRAYQRLSGG